MKNYTSINKTVSVEDSENAKYFTITSDGSLGSNNTYFTNNPISEINFPEYINGIKCTSIAGGTFNMYSGLPDFRYTILKITMPDTITSIGSHSFKLNYSLTNLELSQTLISIGDQVFNSLISLPSITIPKSVRTIGSQAFTGWTSSQTIIFEDFDAITSLSSTWNTNCGANIIKL